MLDNINIYSLQLISVYERNSLIRQRAFEFEKALQRYFHRPFKIISVPDSENHEIPRFEAQENRHSLSVNQVRTSFTQTFEKNTKIAKARELFKNRIESIKPLLQPEKIHFIALIIEMNLDLQSNEEIFQIFRENINYSLTQKEDLVELSLFYARPLENKYYVNVNTSRFEEIEMERKVADPKFEEKSRRMGIRIMLDMNTKLSYQNKIPFDQKIFDDLEEKLFSIANSKTVKDYVNGDII